LATSQLSGKHGSGPDYSLCRQFLARFLVPAVVCTIRCAGSSLHDHPDKHSAAGSRWLGRRKTRGVPIWRAAEARSDGPSRTKIRLDPELEGHEPFKSGSQWILKWPWRRMPVMPDQLTVAERRIDDRRPARSDVPQERSRQAMTAGAGIPCPAGGCRTCALPLSLRLDGDRAGSHRVRSACERRIGRSAAIRAVRAKRLVSPLAVQRSDIRLELSLIRL
jgi:hypothetical protein